MDTTITLSDEITHVVERADNNLDNEYQGVDLNTIFGDVSSTDFDLQQECN